MLQNVLGSCEVVSSALVLHVSRVKQIGWTLKISLICILVDVCLKSWFFSITRMNQDGVATAQ